MNRRTLFLLIAGAAVVVLYLADSQYRSWIEQPTQQWTATRDTSIQKIDQAKERQMVAQKIGRRLDAYTSRGLPADSQLSRSLYQQWLLAQVEKFQIAGASVDASQPIPLEIRSRTKKGKKVTVGHRINFSLHGQASLARIAEFLDAFRDAGHLHKVRSLSLNPVGNEGRLDANLTIEVLCLAQSTNKDSLGQWTLQDETSDTKFTSLVKRNLFARGFAKALNDVQLKAITFNREGVGEAWFTVDGRGTTKTVALGQQVPVALHDIALVDIQADRVLINVNSDPHWLSLGQSLGQVCAQDTTDRQE